MDSQSVVSDVETPVGWRHSKAAANARSRGVSELPLSAVPVRPLPLNNPREVRVFPGVFFVVEALLLPDPDPAMLVHQCVTLPFIH